MPCALFAMGATLAGLPLSERVSETAVSVGLKLFAYPLFMYAAMALLPDVDPVWRTVAVLSAAMPMGAWATGWPCWASAWMGTPQ